MSSRTRLAAFAAIASTTALLTLGSTVPSRADDPANFDKFSTTCMTAGPMLLGDTPDGFDQSAVLTPLCGCLVTEFSTFSQADVDMLTSDLAGTSTDETHAAYANYSDLSGKAGAGLDKCFASDEVTAAINAQPGGAQMTSPDGAAPDTMAPDSMAPMAPDAMSPNTMAPTAPASN